MSTSSIAFQLIIWAPSVGILNSRMHHSGAPTTIHDQSSSCLPPLYVVKTETLVGMIAQSTEARRHSLVRPIKIVSES